MNSSKKIPTSVYAELTPNPAAMKFVADRTLISGGLQVEYRNQKEARGSSPLAEEIFNFPFVKSVFISGNYVTVLKDESLGWEMIVQQLREYIRDWLMSNEVTVSAVPSELLSRLKGVLSYIPIRYPSDYALQNCEWTPMTSDEDWDTSS